jgi:cytochrome c551/c552
MALAAATGAWGTAEEVPGVAALNQGGYAGLTSVSCASAGNCSAGGYYTDGSSARQAFIAEEVNGSWETAEEVPGTAALNQGGSAYLSHVSCASAGTCSAGGHYTDALGHQQVFIAGESNGTWGTAEEVPGTAALNQGGSAYLSDISCASAGTCSAGGHYTDALGHQQVFVAGETNGTWGTAQQVPGTAALNAGGFADISSVSCASAGNCSAGGYYEDSSGAGQAFAVGEKNGIWGTAQEVPGTAALNLGGFAEISSVSCASAGNCSAGGDYRPSPKRKQLFVAEEKSGTWGTAKKVPGIWKLNRGGNVQISSVSCASAGNCGAGGYYTGHSGGFHAFVAGEKNGTWGTAEQVPGTAALNRGEYAVTDSVSCASAGNCSVGGYYLDSAHFTQAFVAGESNGTWGRAQQVPGTPVGQDGWAETDSLSCASAGNCSAGGTYTDSSGAAQAFVVSEAP